MTLKRCTWRQLKVSSLRGKRAVTPAVKHRVIEHWASTGGELLKGYTLAIPDGVNVIDMDGFWTHK